MRIFSVCDGVYICLCPSCKHENDKMENRLCFLGETSEPVCDCSVSPTGSSQEHQDGLMVHVRTGVVEAVW